MYLSTGQQRTVQDREDVIKVSKLPPLAIGPYQVEHVFDTVLLVAESDKLVPISNRPMPLSTETSITQT